MRSLPLSPTHGARLLLLAAAHARIAGGHQHEPAANDAQVRVASRPSTVHAAADAHVAKLSVALRYAFAVGRRRVKASSDADVIARAVRTALEDVLPLMLLKVIADGGTVGAAAVRQFVAAASHTYGSTQINLTGDVASQLLALGQTIPEDELAGQGRETEPHVTVKYGLIDENAEMIRVALEGESFAELTFGDVGYFSGVEDGTMDVVFVRLKSPDLARWHKLIAQAVECAPSAYADYVPHATIAYVKLGRGAHYVGACPLTGTVITVSSVFLSSKDGTMVEVKDGQCALRSAADKPLRFRFDVTNPKAVAWAKKHAGELIQDISDTTRERVAAAIAARLEGDDSLDAIAAAVGDEDRAERIAQHETLLVAHEGQRQAWDQAVDEELLTGQEKRVWITTPDDRLCPICEDLEGETADLDGQYAGEYDGPPAHVGCRCTEGLG